MGSLGPLGDGDGADMGRWQEEGEMALTSLGGGGGCIGTVAPGAGTDRGTDATGDGGGADRAEEVESVNRVRDASDGGGGADEAEEVEGVVVAKEVAATYLPALAFSIFF
ncbi:hypothetical protein NDU88_002787 [Pleurodeles waltl]|uniref:Uncharacterized protein n=1 Tax=Pleurodeles waltl TaxID=8319 RepID=A0AAV7W355_PLEWA|nr:hypothetical protein NDU88_002787 [Pleurodeles waltl]